MTAQASLLLTPLLLAGARACGSLLQLSELLLL